MAGGARHRAGDIPCCITSSTCFIWMATISAAFPWNSARDVLAHITGPTGPLRYSDHFSQGKALFEVARQKGLEGILAKRRTAATKSAAVGSGSRSRSLRPWIASSADIPIRKAAGNISVRSCWACMTRRET